MIRWFRAHFTIGRDTRSGPKEDRLALLERSLCPTGETVLGLYIYTASVQLLRSLNRNPAYRAIVVAYCTLVYE
ncbi:MAG TPA: hypothetical protein VF745_05725 [Steroidobacteraceae bacterium]